MKAVRIFLYIVVFLAWAAFVIAFNYDVETNVFMHITLLSTGATCFLLLEWNISKIGSQLRQNTVKVSIVHRIDGYYANPEDHPSAGGRGETIPESVGDLVLHHQDIFNISIKNKTPHGII